MPNYLPSIFAKLTTAEAPANKDHYLFFLGTDVVFTPKPTAPERSYIRGELFSYLAQVTTNKLGEKGERRKTTAHDALAFYSPSVEVLNGPSTLGSEVGERIAQGLFLALQAGANGKETLQLSGHSRGAVETMLVLHELKRIKEELEKSPEKSLRDILLHSPCKYTQAALKKLIPSNVEEDTPKNRALLLQRLKALKTHAVLIDAVPGDMAGIGWHDPRLYQKLPCDQYEYYLCRDERTSGFYPVIAEKMEVVLLPGHHGTAPGNMFSQDDRDLPHEYKHLKVSSVQDLVLCKWIHFVNQNTGAFKPPSQDHSPINLEHPELDSVLNSYLTADELKRNQLLLDHYLQVLQADPAFRYFAETHYPYLFREYAPGNYRYIHFRNSGFTSMKDAFPEVQRTESGVFTTTLGADFSYVSYQPTPFFVNLDHVKLYIAKYLNLSHMKDSDVKVVAITALLDNLLIEMRGNPRDEHRLLAIVSNDSDRDVFFEAISAFVESISQKYLNEQLSNDEKLGLFKLIQQPFSLLIDAIEDERLAGQHKEVLIKFDKILKTSLKNAIETQFNSTLQEANEIFEDVAIYLNNEGCSQKFNNFINSLTIEDALIAKLEGIKAGLLARNPQTPAEIQEAISAMLKSIRDDSSLDAAQKEKLTTALTGDDQKGFKQYLKAKQHDIQRYLPRIEQLHNKLEWIGQHFMQLQALMGETTINVHPHRQTEECQRLVQLAGTMLVHTKHDLRYRPSTMSDYFFTKVKEQTPVPYSYLSTVLSAPVAAAKYAGGAAYAAASFVGSFFYSNSKPSAPPSSDKTPDETPGGP